jgi:hypothetical protein
MVAYTNLISFPRNFATVSAGRFAHLSIANRLSMLFLQSDLNIVDDEL